MKGSSLGQEKCGVEGRSLFRLVIRSWEGREQGGSSAAS